jgi:hypothetical protein
MFGACLGHVWGVWVGARHAGFVTGDARVGKWGVEGCGICGAWGEV